MSGDKLRVAKAAVAEAIARLGPDDRFSVVAYDDVVDVVIASTAAAGESRRAALEQLRTIEARGSTNLGEGWLRGCEQVAGHLLERGVNRCLLLTDGLANVGITEPGELAAPRRRAARAAASRPRRSASATTSTSASCRRSADAGGGHFYYIADAPADRRRDHVRGGRDPRGRGPRRRARGDRPRRHPDRADQPVPRDARTATARRSRIGDLASEQVVEVVLRLSFPYGDVGRDTGAIVSLTDRDGTFAPGGAARDRAGPADLELRRPCRQRPAGPRPRGRPGRRPPVRGASPPGGGRAQPRRRLHPCSLGHGLDGGADPRATPATTRSSASLVARARELRHRRSRRRWPSPAASSAHYASANLAAQPRRAGPFGQARLSSGAQTSRAALIRGV